MASSWRTPGYVGSDPGVFTKPSTSGAAELKDVKPEKMYFKPSRVLSKTKKRDADKAAAIAAALQKAKSKYTYHSGNIMAPRGGTNKMIES